MNRKILLSLVGLTALFSLIGCGGGGGNNGGILPPASDPTRSTKDIANPQAAADNAKALQMPGVLVPQSTITKSSDLGYRAHTNHLIYTGAGTRGSAPSGFTPDEIRTAYGIPASLGGGAIAIVDAFHYPTALNDFNVFSGQFGLPTEPSANATLSTNTVFQVVYASGSIPATDASWAQESAIDTQWAHAMASGAKIYLVEAASDTVGDLMAAVNVAKNLPGVKQVSMSFGATETGCLFVKYDSAMVKGGVSFFGASGDSSNDRNFPALSKNAVCVGGTSLVLDVLGNRLTENSWSASGAGASLFEPRPKYQDVVVNTVLGYRGGCDVAAVGDPNTGVSVYDSTPYLGMSGWLTFGGTSVACPIIAGISNAAGNTYSSSQTFNTNLYAQLGLGSLYDVKHGTSGAYSAGTGWDFLSGVGAPNGLTGF